MTMETQKNSYSDLYLMLSPIYDTLHLRRCNLGDKGFEEFALENVQRAHDQALFPNNWMFHYHFSEEQIPRIKSLDGMHRRDVFQKLRPALLHLLCEVMQGGVFLWNKASFVRLCHPRGNDNARPAPGEAVCRVPAAQSGS